MSLNYRKGLSEMPSYDVVERPWEIKVNANESTLNLPPLVEERLMARFSHVAFHRYPNEEYDLLREQIAENFSDGHGRPSVGAVAGCDAFAPALQKENVLIGSGSSEIIEKLFYSFGGSENHAILFPQPSFSMYRIYAKAAEAKGVPFPLGEDYALDVEGFIAAAKEHHAALAVVCNPNNPTGNALSLKEIEAIAGGVDCAFLVDEAYIEFSSVPSAAKLLSRYPNLIVARTFSKAYGLASARVGYMLASKEIVSMVEKAYMPYHMNVLSLVTADIVYQMRHEFEPRIHMMVSERKRMSKLLAELPGFTVYPSETNFLLMKHERAKEINACMEERGIGIRSFGDAKGLANCLRISMGTREENDAWFGVIKAFAEGRA